MKKSKKITKTIEVDEVISLHCDSCEKQFEKDKTGITIGISTIELCKFPTCRQDAMLCRECFEIIELFCKDKIKHWNYL